MNVDDPENVGGERTENEIGRYFHCAECLREKPDDQSPGEWARLAVGFTNAGVQVWCTRHDRNVVHLDFLGQKIGYAGNHTK
jgi:hypothetical protein